MSSHSWGDRGLSEISAAHTTIHLLDMALRDHGFYSERLRLGAAAANRRGHHVARDQVSAVVLALVQLEPGTVALAGLGHLAVNAGLGNLVEPYLMGRTLGLSTLVIFLSLVFWGWLWGPVGMLLSVPLTMVVKITLENSDNFRWVAILLAANPGKGD